MALSIQRAIWPEDKDKLASVRRQVFIEEQNVPEELEWDKFDETAIHCLATIDGNAVGTGRLMSNGQLGRMAVLKTFRHQGIGSKLLELLINEHRKISDKPIIIHAQTHAVNFYQKFGFVIKGDEFDEAGIPHYTMILTL